MGVVYEAVSVGLNRPVALKVLSDEFLTRPHHRARFRDEAEAVARLGHPNVVQIYEVSEHDGRPFLALELVPGGTLADRLAAGPLPVPEAVDLIRTLARAVQHAHDRGVIHRDLKPANVLLGNAEFGVRNSDSKTRTAGSDSAIRIPNSAFVKLTDFGIAKRLDTDRGRTRTGMLLGTPAYMAPEVVADGPRAATAATDVYGLGAILYECLAGRPAADGANTWATLRQVVAADFDPPGRVRPGVASGLDAVCLKALAKDPAARYPSARALADDLDRLAAGRPVRARNPARWLRALRRRPAAVLGCLAALAILAGWAALAAFDYQARYHDGAEADRVGRELLGRGAYAEAEQVFAHGLRRVGGLPWADTVTADLTRHLRLSHRGRRAAELHLLVDRLRFGYDADSLAGSDLRAVATACDALWAARDALAPAAGPDLGPEPERQLRTDLLDLALLSADFRAREGGGRPEAVRAALGRLDEAERSLGASPVLARVRAAYRAGPGHPTDPADGAPLSPWELYALGRSRLYAGDLAAAAEFLRQAVDRDTAGFWPNFHLAVCAYRRGRPAEAVGGFSACLVAARDRRGLCHYHRGLAYVALGDARNAIRDFDRALELEPGLAEAALNRGLLHHDARRFPEAIADLERALRGGCCPAVACYGLAVVHLAAGDRRTARDFAARAVGYDPCDEKAKALLDQLRTDR
jgi:tetratricopeptide (TPR) repeat protein